MSKPKLAFAALGLMTMAVAGAENIDSERPLALRYHAPATNWVTQALPIGNGDMGAMIAGGIDCDHIQFNHKTLWKGSAATADLGSYLNFGDLYICNTDSTEASAYVRTLDLQRAVASVNYSTDGTDYARQYFASNPDSVIVINYLADGHKPLDLRLRLESAQGAPTAYTATGGEFRGSLANGMKYAAEFRLETHGGRVEADSAGITVVGAEAMTVFLTCGTDFNPKAANHMTGNDVDLTSRLASASTLGIDRLLDRHVNDYSSLFGRVEFKLDGAENSLPTDSLLKSDDPAARKMTDMLIFQYGRYLTIASSRGISVPSNLQGIWNKDGDATTDAVWASDIHSNINVQMNYWPAEPTNLSECHLPFLRYIENEALRPDGTWSRNARELGVDRGWVVNTAGNIFGGSSRYKAGKYAVANAWYCQHLWQHFAYSQDVDFLRQTAMPVMRSACEFWIDRLVEAPDGTLECPMEYSPEQGRVQNAPAHSQQLVGELFENTLKAAEILGEESEFTKTVADRLSRLDRGLRIDENGLLREWKYQENTPNQPADRNYFADDEANVWQGHRHTSHLIGLYPVFSIDPGIDGDIFNAAVASLADRGDTATGWARAWRISLWARARNAAKAYNTLRGFAHHTDALTYDWHGGLYDNMLDAHATSVFQIEGNFGATAGIAEMLLQSRPDSLVLLPALPEEWVDGRISGLKAIGNFEVGMSWSGGRLSQVEIISNSGLPLTLRYPGIETARLSGDEEANRETPGRLSFPTRPGGRYVITPARE